MIDNKKKEVTLVREFSAPRALVWKAWTDPKLIAQWWGPQGVTNPICEFDPTPNGVVHIVMEAGESMGPYKGTQWPMTGIIKEIDEPSKLVFSSVNIKDEAGNSTFETLNTITFEEVAGKTKVTVHIEVTVLADIPNAQQAYGGMVAGWTQSLEKLSTFIVTQ